MIVGDKIGHLCPTFGGISNGLLTPKQCDGVVVYIHPQRRFFIVEFKFEYGSFRQSFYFPARAAGDYSRRSTKK